MSDPFVDQFQELAEGVVELEGIIRGGVERCDKMLGTLDKILAGGHTQLVQGEVTLDFQKFKDRLTELRIALWLVCEDPTAN